VTLAYLKGKDAESEEAQEHANNSSLALYAEVVSKESISSGRSVASKPEIFRSRLQGDTLRLARHPSKKA